METGTAIRTAVLAIALVNQVLVNIGWTSLPYTMEEQEKIVSSLILVVASLWSWFKNNYVTSKGKKQKEVLEEHGLD